jgi:hypothetical protein
MDKAYFAKWSHLKYCTQVIKYSITNGLSFINPVEQESFRPQGTFVEGVTPETFGSGRLLKHHLEEVRMDPADRQFLTLAEFKQKFSSWTHARLFANYWRRAMQEVRVVQEKEQKQEKEKGPRKGDLLTFAELGKFFSGPEAERTQLTFWDVDMRPELDNDKKLVVRKMDPARMREPDEKTGELKRKGHTYDKLEANYDTEVLLFNTFRHTMELIGTRQLPKILDKVKMDQRRNKTLSNRTEDPGFTEEELRSLIHTPGQSADI